MSNSNEDGLPLEGSGRTPEEDDSLGVAKAIGRQVKVWREAAGMRQADLGQALGYSDEMIGSIERGRRLPKPDLLLAADQLLDANGKLAVMRKDLVEARYPKKVRDQQKLEAEATELGAYSNHNIHGLLQTEEYARALFAMRRPALSADEVDQYVSGRVARHEILDRTPSVMLTFVQEETTLRRPLGGRMVLRRQLEHLLRVGELRNVEIQVMPTAREDHAGMGGEVEIVKLMDGETVARLDAQNTIHLVSVPRDVQPLELRYGIVRSQALNPQESRAFIEKMLGET